MSKSTSAGVTLEEESESDMTASEEENPWIQWFVNMRGNEFFCAVDEDFVRDDFNLTGLSPAVPLYDYALDMILDIEVELSKFQML